MSEQRMDHDPGSDIRWLHVLVLLVVGGSAVGFVLGVQPEAPRPLPSPPAAPEVATAPPAATYAELRTRSLGPNAGWSSSIEALKEAAPLAALPPGEEREAGLVEALEARAERRAFDGAPPSIPHAVGQSQAAECMACHGEGLVVDGKIAPKLSHEAYSSCTQCHVVEGNPVPAGLRRAEPFRAGSDFQGLAPTPHGERAYLGAAPQLPHTTWMRSDCRSCHGRRGHPAMQTTHDDRRSCTQCHAPSAALEQQSLTFDAATGRRP